MSLSSAELCADNLLSPVSLFLLAITLCAVAALQQGQSFSVYASVLILYFRD